ncbi:MAG: hypothetical protein MJZ58_06830, partial [Paludibacteraceae bacterium]|nr:hypothetical protein [Paludibacteraceae bacterium]
MFNIDHFIEGPLRCKTASLNDRLRLKDCFALYRTNPVPKAIYCQKHTDKLPNWQKKTSKISKKWDKVCHFGG